MTSRRSGRWIIPKGWPMLGKSLSAEAAREAFEEAGIFGEVESQPMGGFKITKRNLFGRVKIDILVHSFAVEEELSDWPERAERERKWFAIKDAVAVVECAELACLISTMGKRLQPDR